MESGIINFYSENKFVFGAEERHREWLLVVIASEQKKLDELNFIFCDDQYLLEINQKYLDHNTYTDIISFGNSVGEILAGDIFISVQRVMENSAIFEVSFEEELQRVLVHGILHLCGFKDKTDKEKVEMRRTENEKIRMFHVEQ